MSTQHIGSRGERIARHFCIHQGWKICSTNWRHGHGEIDIIAQHKGVHIFIEVKFRQSATFGYPEEAITPKKIQTLRKTIAAYIRKEKILRYRFDVISIISYPNTAPEITHLPDIPLLPSSP